jgi:ATP adenylyltransferase/5',5'''-P-1,P-4-tetraphosphate phosphorylase II
VQHDENHQEAYTPRAGSDINTLGFELGNIGEDHFVAVNKFCFARPHLMLLTTDGHRKQYEPLFSDDLEAVWSVLETMGSDYLAFYNCGKLGGCSRLHKHLQIMPKPRDSFASFLDEDDTCSEPLMPFQWYHRRFENHQITPRFLTETYCELLAEASRANAPVIQDTEQVLSESASPHNMILTKKWMIVLPRRHAAVNKEAGVNAMGMLGVVAIATQEELRGWEILGPKNVLRHLGVPR